MEARNFVSFWTRSAITIVLLVVCTVIPGPIGPKIAPAQFPGLGRRMPNLSAPRRLIQGNTRLAEPVVTQNFVVRAPDRQFAERVARDAERYRQELSQLWLGYEIEPWSERCPIEVKFERGAGGRTTFSFDSRRQRSKPSQWQMEIFGPPERILDSVLPHEITHTIFATHFGRPLPRWADEGACTTVEHESERQKNHQMLLDILSSRPSRGIPFNRMFQMYQYPEDLFPLYAQGYSLARFLLLLDNQQAYIQFVETGLEYEEQGLGLQGWNLATSEIYGVDDLGELQLQWLAWVKQGCPGNATVLASQQQTTQQPESQPPTGHVELLDTATIYEQVAGRQQPISDPRLEPGLTTSGQRSVAQASVLPAANDPGPFEPPEADPFEFNSQPEAVQPNRNPLDMATTQAAQELKSQALDPSTDQFEAISSIVLQSTIDYLPGSVGRANMQMEVAGKSQQGTVFRTDVQFRKPGSAGLPDQLRTRPTIFR